MNCFENLPQGLKLASEAAWEPVEGVDPRPSPCRRWADGVCASTSRLCFRSSKQPAGAECVEHSGQAFFWEERMKFPSELEVEEGVLGNYQSQRLPCTLMNGVCEPSMAGGDTVLASSSKRFPFLTYVALVSPGPSPRSPVWKGDRLDPVRPFRAEKQVPIITLSLAERNDWSHYGAEPAAPAVPCRGVSSTLCSPVSEAEGRSSSGAWRSCLCPWPGQGCLLVSLELILCCAQVRALTMGHPGCWLMSCGVGACCFLLPQLFCPGMGDWRQDSH